MMKKITIIVWLVVLVAAIIHFEPYMVHVNPTMDVEDFVSHNPKWVQKTLKDYDIYFVNKIDDGIFGLTDRTKKTIKVLKRKNDVLQEQNTLSHEIGHVVANELKLTKDKKMQRLWKKYGKDLISAVEPDNAESIEYHTSTMDEGLAETYVYYLYKIKVPDNKFFKYYKSVLDKAFKEQRGGLKSEEKFNKKTDINFYVSNIYSMWYFSCQCRNPIKSYDTPLC